MNDIIHNTLVYQRASTGGSEMYCSAVNFTSSSSRSGDSMSEETFIVKIDGGWGREIKTGVELRLHGLGRWYGVALHWNIGRSKLRGRMATIAEVYRSSSLALLILFFSIKMRCLNNTTRRIHQQLDPFPLHTNPNSTKRIITLPIHIPSSYHLVSSLATPQATPPSHFHFDKTPFPVASPQIWKEAWIPMGRMGWI